VRFASTVAGAKELLLDYTPDIIILEKDLPDADGLEYCRELRSASDVLIMLLSNDKDDELPALDAGAMAVSSSRIDLLRG
jgi:DNA-binding response OmpR family regulator